MTTIAPADAPPLPGLIRIGCGLGAISDEDLERICNDNPGWKFELDSRRVWWSSTCTSG